METTSGFQSSASARNSTPTTPPQTPHRRKRRLSTHTVSPASSPRSAIRPNVTSSPAPKKKATKRRLVEDSVTVEELTDVDAGYIADIEIVYPHELEEVESLSAGSQGKDSEDENATTNTAEGTTTGIVDEDDDDDDIPSDNDAGDSVAEQFSRLHCASYPSDDLDSAEAAFEKKRREKHIRRRAESRVFKRPHSLIINPEIDVADSEAMADHDLPMSARRLRRRVQGPMEGEAETVGSDVAMSPADSMGMMSPGVPTYGRRNRQEGRAGDGEEMDVDGSE